MTDKLIIEKLDDQAERLKKIEQAISIIAVQDQKILNIQAQISSLWKKHDAAFSPDGVVSEIKNFQASCPREQIKIDLAKQWIIIALLAAIVTGSLLKAFGAF